jgi:hypothetical protein
MAIQFQRLITPGKGVSTLMDFAPLAGAVNDGITGYYDNKRRTAIGAAAQQGNAAAAQEALRQGELDTGAQYQRLAQQDTDRATQAKDRQVKMLGGIAQAAKFEQDPARRALLWNTGLKRAGVNPADLDPDELDPMTGPDVFLAASGMAQDPRESQFMDLKMQEAQIGIQDKKLGVQDRQQNIANRKAFLDSLGGAGAGDVMAGLPEPVRKAAMLRAQAGDTDGALDIISKASVPTPLSVAERKQVFNSEDDAVMLTNQIKTLDTALGLISEDKEKAGTAAYEGWGAGVAGQIGARAPYGDAIFDGTRSKATDEYSNIMSLEAIKAMSETLKGATTNFELQKFEDILSDPSQPRETRRKVISRMKELLQSKADLANRRSKELRSGTYFRPGEGQGGSGLDQMTDEELLQELGR